MRGTRSRRSGARAARRIIPAHAGNSTHAHGRQSVSADHPRACGELKIRGDKKLMAFGSSPRMRGTLLECHRHAPVVRIIPAHAGNSMSARISSSLRPDHPRACGELSLGVYQVAACVGSSPRMRGTPILRRALGNLRRIIPAHAGNSCSTSAVSSASSDHPRACGELAKPCAVSSVGSSPRMRGTRDIWLARSENVIRRIIPAHAGNSISMPTTVRDVIRRIIPAHAGNSISMPTQSPETDHRRIIPAHAGNSIVSDHPRATGNSSRARSPSLTESDHPRACGELPHGRAIASTRSRGSSPRMRGTRTVDSRWCTVHRRSRIIPAHAGNSSSSTARR